MPDNPSDDDNTTTSTWQHCPVCQSPFTPVRRQRYCCDNCRKTAWARRHAAAAPPQPPPPPGPRRDVTVYSCPACDTRYYRQQ